MAKTEHYYQKFESECFYHVYNRTVDLKPLFREDENYRYFLKRYDYYMSQYIDTYAYCLLGNHFHLLIRIKKFDLTVNVHKLVSAQLKKFFQSYSMSFNKRYNRVGTLFQTPFKRAIVDHRIYIQNLVTYIHLNPAYHGLVRDFKDWKWSSYHSINSKFNTKLKNKELLKFYENEQDYIHNHLSKNKIEYNLDLFLGIEDD